MVMKLTPSLEETTVQRSKRHITVINVYSSIFKGT